MARAPTYVRVKTPAALLAPVLAYHERTKHYPGRYARASAAMDWTNQPDPFRRFEGLFVHRVAGMVPGLYALLRDPLRKETLQQQMMPSFVWTAPDACPTSLPLFLLEAGDARLIAARTSCEQDIASDGVFATAMLADYRGAMESFGPWFYRHLHWEAGMVGQQLYLEAEASGIRATGIGCFFDDLTHRTFGIEDDRFQVLYHLTMGGALEDPRIQIAPPYQHLQGGPQDP